MFAARAGAENGGGGSENNDSEHGAKALAPSSSETFHDRWKLGDYFSTVWPVESDPSLPHEDFIEQGGLRAGQEVHYKLDAHRALSLRRGVVWPGLRIFPNQTGGGLIHDYGAEAEPAVTIDGSTLPALTVDRIILDGTLRIEGHSGDLSISRKTFPSHALRTVIDFWTLRNSGTASHTVAVAPLALHQESKGPYGTNVMEASCTAPASAVLAPGEEMRFAVLFSARLENEPPEHVDPAAEEKARESAVSVMQGNLVLETPQPELNQAFTFAKIRVAESINATRGGLMLAPGGMKYYAAVWCNDNVEYAGPFFPFLGDENGNQASLDTYRIYMPYMKPDYGKIPSSIVAEGVDTWGGAGDRGDAAMYAYGCARFCLARGDETIARELWPGIAWCLEYCERQKTKEGVIASDSDELEGRFGTGKANLSTSSLCYGGLRSAANLARSLGKAAEAETFDSRADALGQSIEHYFGAVIDGFSTYRYYEGNDVLRSWICLPLCMGLLERRTGTLDALFSPHLWTEEGVLTQEGPAGRGVYWDRSTLYALRGAFQAGDTERALRCLTSYSHRRLLGEHAPYAVETGWGSGWGGSSQLSSESGLYCRVFTEGLFGIEPTGLNEFRCTPRLPDAWLRMALRSVRAFNRNFDVTVERAGDKQHLTIVENGSPVLDRMLEPGESATVRLP